MADNFKGIDLDAGLKRIVPHMAMAMEYGGALQQLQTVWDNLSLLGQLAGTGIDISNTRRAFSDLASDLLNQLAGNAKHDAFGVFVDSDGRVIACSDDRFPAGERLAVEDSLLQLNSGCGRSGIVALGDAYYAVGANASSGYREYKGASDAERRTPVWQPLRPSGSDDPAGRGRNIRRVRDYPDRQERLSGRTGGLDRPPSRERVIGREHDDRTEHRNNQAVDIEAGDPGCTEETE
jgi:hypothetical protein